MIYRKSLQKLNSKLLISAYSSGYFPMPDPKTDQIFWYSPDPRAHLPLTNFHVSKSLRRQLNKTSYTITHDKAFRHVMLGCANRKETWINKDFLDAYYRLFRHGYAHSVECWQKEDLVAGVYGVSIGGAFFAESKFHRQTNMSKIVLYKLTKHLREKGFTLLEVQFLTTHLASLGAIEIPAKNYRKRLKLAIKQTVFF